MISGRKTLEVMGSCTEHGDDVRLTLENSTFTEARSHTWDCPHEDDGNNSVQVVEIWDTETRQVAWTRPYKLDNVGGVEHRDYEFD